MYRTVETMHCCEYFMEIIIVVLKDRIAEINFFCGNKHYCWKNYSKNHYVKSVRIRSYSVRMRENTDQNKSEYGDVSRSE